LFTIVMTIMLIRILGQASKGKADPSEVILLIALAIPQKGLTHRSHAEKPVTIDCSST